MIIYHNPRCRKSREGLAYLQEKGQEFEVREYLKDPLNEGEMTDLVAKLGIQAKELVRKGEQIFKDQFKGKDLSEKEWVQAMVTNPKLIERPIIEKGNKAVVGRPKEEIDKLL